MSIKVTSKTYQVKGPSETKFDFIKTENGITIPGVFGGDSLIFKNSKVSVVRAFHNVLGQFLDEVDKDNKLVSDDTDPFFRNAYEGEDIISIFKRTGVDVVRLEKYIEINKELTKIMGDFASDLDLYQDSTDIVDFIRGRGRFEYITYNKYGRAYITIPIVISNNVFYIGLNRGRGTGFVGYKEYEGSMQIPKRDFN